MKIRNSVPLITFFLLFFSLTSIPGMAQEHTETTPDLNLEKGTVLTSFSVGWVNASRDKSYNHEFEHGYEQLSFTLDGLYFLNESIGVGPLLGYNYVYRDFESQDNTFTPNDTWDWAFEYGVQAGYYSPVKQLFQTDVLGNSRLFVTGGVSWLRTKYKFEQSEDWFDPNTEFGYALSTGILVPLGKKAGLEWRFKWEARAQEYQTGHVDDNNNIVVTGSETRWPSILSLGLGLKVGF